MAEFLRSVAHPARVQILAQGIPGESTLLELMRTTNLSKTALLNHLAMLTDAGLLERVARGAYRTTEDGRGLLAAATSVHKGSKKRSREEKEAIQRTYATAFSGTKNMEKNELKKMQYAPSWLSYLGAMTGCLRYLGVRCGTREVGGYSGCSFLINVSRGETCPSGPTALHLKTFREMVHGTESLGWKIDVFVHQHPYPSKEGAPTAEEMALVRGIFERIKKEIDERRRPVVLWGLAAPEYGIVRGYVGDSYIVRTFRSAADPPVPDDPIPFYELKAPGCIDAFYFKGKLKISKGKARREALDRALRFASGEIDVAKNYIAGPPALEEWASVLESLDESAQNYMGNSYVGACVHEGRELSGSFMKQVAKQLPAGEARHLRAAAGCYEKGARSMASFTKLFPFQFKGEMPLEKRRKGAQLLRRVRAEEDKAVQHVRKVC
ncbi:MAG: helix-turn-helix domain-containing protein [Thermoplasmata archaeon]|nr:helix-turn-helix domain-containing protein [Thermoplasmata archaeon]